MTNTQDNREREQLLQRVDDLLVEIISPVLKAVVNGTNPTGLATAGTKKVTDFILADRAAQKEALLEEAKARARIHLIENVLAYNFKTVEDMRMFLADIRDHNEQYLATPQTTVMEKDI